ncbi:MAG: exodeoxyribonuclease VII large subunit [Firmicutes bacterium]|nr:exodeoxyribonuclease VII large subunit [Bacillota bacterium]
MQVNVYTVSQINGYIKRLIDSDVFLSGLHIEGEISNFKLHSSGHLYFSLKDKTGSIDCVMFRSAAQYLEFMPKNGDAVLVGGRVSLYEKTGKYQVYVDYMQPAGLGALHAEFEKLKQKLAAEGLFDEKFKKPIPEYPKTVALVTSPTGAAVRDMIDVSRRRNPSIKLVIVPVLVQGENAAADIAKGIELVNEWGGADTIIVGRGGGSMEDLWAFNEEIVARAIFKSEIPVISAVGHEVDFTIADFAADFRAPTPSAAAELAIPASEPVQRRFKTASRRMMTACDTRLSRLDMRFKHAISTRSMQRPLEKIENYQIYTEDMLDSIKKTAEMSLQKYGARFEKALAAVDNLSPINVVKRGYSLAYAGNELLKSVSQVRENDEIDVTLKDGSLNAVVRRITNGGEEKEL